MQKTVQEIIAMMDGINPTKFGRLHHNQSTQREFIYNSMMCNDGDITKAGDVIRSILEKHIKFPAVYFWNVQDDDRNIHFAKNEYNIMDGKQRLLSIYYFVRPQKNMSVVTRINGVETTFARLDKDEQDYLLNYTFDIVEQQGTAEEEEQAFMLINRCGVPLTAYEALRGAFHGKFFDTFEDYIDTLKYDNIKEVGRGEQAQYFLYMCLGIINSDRHKMATLASGFLPALRDTKFEEKNYRLAEKLDLYAALGQTQMICTNSANKDPEKLCRIVDYVINKGYNSGKVIAYYTEAKHSKQLNDIGKWKFAVHKTAIDALFDDIKCDFRRFFTQEEKIDLYSRKKTCSCCGKDLTFQEAEVDHIQPWSKGYPTNLMNAQLLCKNCNTSKGATEND